MKTNIIAASIIGAMVIATALFIAYRKDKEINHKEQYLNDKVDSLLQEVKSTKLLLQELNQNIALHSDTIRILETKLPIIKNNYYSNEKEILTTNDSLNRTLRIRDQLLFEREYFSGRYNPKTK